MAELKPTDKINTIALDAIINIPISGAFYSRIQQCTFALLQQKMTEDPNGTETNKILKELETREPNDLWETLVTVNLALLYATEEAAKEQKLVIQQNAVDFLPKDSDSEVSPES